MRDEVIDLIKALTTGSATNLVCRDAASPNPYSEGTFIDIYADDKGYEYWIDPSSGRLVQAGPSASAGSQTPPDGPAQRLPVAALRQLATALIGTQITDFAKRRASLHPLEDNRDGLIYFFRWDDFAAPLKESELPPFIQVALTVNGRFASYTNTLV